MANPAMMRAFVETEGRKGVRVERARRQPKKRKKAIRTESTKQQERTAFLHGIKAARLHAQGGPYSCEGNCGARYATFDEAWKALTVSHVEPRNDTSTRYERRREPDFRGDDPRNILIECVPCNARREPDPEWSAA